MTSEESPLNFTTARGQARAPLMRRRQPPNEERNPNRRARNSRRGNWRHKWARIPFERKLAMFVAPVFVAVITGILLRVVGGSVPIQSSGTPAQTSQQSGQTKVEYQRRIREICSDRALLVPQYEEKART